MIRLCRSLLPLLVVFGAVAIRPQQPGDAVPDVRLEPHGGKTHFYLGEPIRLDLLYENHTGKPFTINATDYGDMSEKVEITPKTGWFQWQGQSGHDYSMASPLTGEPVRIAVRLDEGYVFQEPGTYRVRVEARRLSYGAGMGQGQVPATLTNEVAIELEAMPESKEAEILERIRADMANAGTSQRGDSQRRSAMRRLAALQGDQALAEKMKWLQSDDDDFRQLDREAFATTRNLERQEALLRDAWINPAIPPSYDIPDLLTETRMLRAGRGLEGWRMVMSASTATKIDPVQQRISEAHHADMAALLASVPQRTGESRSDAAYLLLEFGGLTDAERTKALDYAVEEFPHMDSTEQHMLLETARPPLRDARLIPTLREMLAKDPSDKDASAALLTLAPMESSTWITSAVCAKNNGWVMLDTFKDATVDRVPEVDACLGDLLKTPPKEPRAAGVWDQRATAAARFATPAIAPAVEAGWVSPRGDSGMLAVLMRDEPAGAVKLLESRRHAGSFDGMLFYATSQVYKQIHKPFAPEVRTWLLDLIDHGSDKDAGMAAYALSLGGDPGDAVRIEARLKSLRNAWQGREAVLNAKDASGDAMAARMAEVELMGALVPYDSRIRVPDEDRKRLIDACLSDQCRLYAR